MTAYGIPYLNVCLRCREEFAPIEGNETREFCSEVCEEVYWDSQEIELAIDESAEVYRQDYGKEPPWLKGL